MTRQQRLREIGSGVRAISRQRFSKRNASLIYTIVLGLLIVGTTSLETRAQIVNDKTRSMTDERVINLLMSENPTEAALATEEIFNRGDRMISLLANSKGQRRRFCAVQKLGNWGPGTAVTFLDNDPCRPSTNVTTEVASLFLINAIYYNDVEFAGPPLLCYRHTDSRGETQDKCRNDARRIHIAWVSVKRWMKDYRKRGMDALRKSGEDPLFWSRVSFY